MTEIPTDHNTVYLATGIDLDNRRLLNAAAGLHPDAQLACDAIRMAVAARRARNAIWATTKPSGWTVAPTEA